VYQLQWFGGHKGFGLGMLVEMMSGLLADSAFGTFENSDSALTGRERVTERCEGRECLARESDMLDGHHAGPRQCAGRTGPGRPHLRARWIKRTGRTRL
jgi:LDH2 family malate/lactate/ureidoglycolate dehydrogenase